LSKAALRRLAIFELFVKRGSLLVGSASQGNRRSQSFASGGVKDFERVEHEIKQLRGTGKLVFKSYGAILCVFGKPA
jgi:hypothetical protein